MAAAAFMYPQLPTGGDNQAGYSGFGTNFSMAAVADWRPMVFDNNLSPPAGAPIWYDAYMGMMGMQTRNKAGAAGPQQSKPSRQPMPKGFLPPTLLPIDPNAMRSKPILLGEGQMPAEIQQGMRQAYADMKQHIDGRIAALLGASAVQAGGGRLGW